MNDKELSLVEQIYDRHSELAFSEILEFSAFSREPTFRHLQNLVNEGIVKKRQIGNLFLYSINYDNPQTSSVLSMLITRKIKNLQIGELINMLNKKFVDMPVLFSLISKPIKKGRSTTFNIVVVTAGDKNGVFQELRKLEKQTQYTTKFKISISLYDIEEFKTKMNKETIKDMIPFFNSERLFMMFRYK